MRSKDDIENQERITRQPYLAKRWKLYSAIVFLSLFSAAVLYLHSQVYTKAWPYARSGRTGSNCNWQRATKRREWRSMSLKERDAYLNAIKCLQRTPGQVSNEQSRFEDFAYHHSRIGNISHNGALFLPWHRVLVHAFEQALKSHCSHSDGVPYWDWTLDHKSLQDAPIWDPIHGFGGNGSVERLDNGLSAVGNGSCVLDGPFANRTALYYSHKKKPHCLSRGFAESSITADGKVREPGYDISPSRIEQVLSQENYDAFWKELEHGPHNAIPRFIRGDFSVLTAPNDPVFFSHHSQLDRLWWQWQMRDQRRFSEYNGRANKLSSTAASLDDVIHLGGLAADIAVGYVMNTMGKSLCYSYV